MTKEDNNGYYTLIISRHLYCMSRMHLLILPKFPLKLMRHSCKTQARKPPYNYVQLGLAGTFVILTYHQLSASAAIVEKFARLNEHICSFTCAFHFTLFKPTSLHAICVYSIFQAVHLPGSQKWADSAQTSVSI